MTWEPPWLFIGSLCPFGPNIIGIEYGFIPTYVIVLTGLFKPYLPVRPQLWPPQLSDILGGWQCQGVIF